MASAARTPHPAIPLNAELRSLSRKGGRVHFGPLAQFISHTGLPSGLTRGPLSTCRKPGFRGAQAGPRVKPEGSKVLVWATNIDPGRSNVNTPPQGGGSAGRRSHDLLSFNRSTGAIDPAGRFEARPTA